MGRSSEGWRLRLDPRTGCYTVRFSLPGGARRHLSTHERDQATATRVAQALYSAALVGSAQAARGVARGKKQPLPDAVAAWLDAIDSELDERTIHSYHLYASGQWFDRWAYVEDITRASAAEYTRARLRKVLRRTVVKELSALRGLLRWLFEQEPPRIPEVPVIDQPPRRAVGTPDTSRQLKRQAVELDSREVEAIIAELPEWSPGGPTSAPWRVRARIIFAWETGLRPATVSALRAPDDYRRGAKVLTIREEADKARAGRHLKLSPRARQVLEAVCPDEGAIFGAHRVTEYLREAARKAARKRRLSRAKAERVSVYDLRHARLTHLAGVSEGDLPGLMQLAGHKNASTTSKYIRAVAARTERMLERAAETAAPPAPMTPGDELEGRRILGTGVDTAKVLKYPRGRMRRGKPNGSK